jgi:hypothetical protein
VNAEQAPKIPLGCYDCGDGYYDPSDEKVKTYGGEELRVPGTLMWAATRSHSFFFFLFFFFLAFFLDCWTRCPDNLGNSFRASPAEDEKKWVLEFCRMQEKPFKIVSSF